MLNLFGKYDATKATKKQNIMFVNKLSKRVVYEKSYKLIISWLNPTQAAADRPKNKHICKQENNLNAFEFRFMKYVVMQKIIAFNPKQVSEIKSTKIPIEKDSNAPKFLSDL